MEKDTNNKDSELCIDLGYADEPKQKDFYHENFPSKVGGKPILLFPFDNKKIECDYCAGKLSFLMQLYCALDDIEHIYHRTLYVFVCLNCYIYKPSFKCFRQQLPEKSEYYNGVKVKDLKLLQNSYLDLNKILYPEYNIGIESENDQILELIEKIGNKLNKSSDYKSTIENLDEDIIEDLEMSMLSKKDLKMIKEMIKQYDDNLSDNNQTNDDDILNENAEDEFLEKVENRNNSNSDKDIYFQYFFKITNNSPTQIVRYSRNNPNPLWYCKNGVLSQEYINKNFKCLNCGSVKKIEFQIMPFIFNLYKELINNDIGTILVYTCDCDIKFIEEHIYVQRTGEKLFDINKKGNLNIKSIPIMESKLEGDEDSDFNDNEIIIGGNTNNTPDEDGFIEVNKKKKKTKFEIDDEIEKD